MNVQAQSEWETMSRQAYTRGGGEDEKAPVSLVAGSEPIFTEDPTAPCHPRIETNAAKPGREGDARVAPLHAESRIDRGGRGKDHRGGDRASGVPQGPNPKP